MLWLQGIPDQRILFELFSSYVYVTFDLRNNEMEIHQKKSEPWRVALIDTGESTQTGGRIKRIKEHLDGTFCLTYGDGLSDIDIEQLIAFHQEQKTLVTVTAIQPAGSFGSIEISGTKAQSF